MDMLYKHADICYQLGYLDRELESLERILIFAPDRKDVLQFQKEILHKKNQYIIQR
jgi:hypothetical protein